MGRVLRSQGKEAAGKLRPILNSSKMFSGKGLLARFSILLIIELSAIDP